MKKSKNGCSHPENVYRNFYDTYSGADLKKNLTAEKGCGPKVNGQKGRGQKPFVHAQCKVVK